MIGLIRAGGPLRTTFELRPSIESDRSQVKVNTDSTGPSLTAVRRKLIAKRHQLRVK